MATALNVPLEKMLDRAGYKTSPKRNAAKDRLGRIYDLLCAGKVDLAILELLRLNDRIIGSRTAVGPRGGGVAATNFARAVVLLDGLPSWLLEVILKAMQERVNDNKHEPETHPRVKNLIRIKCIEELRTNRSYKFTSASSFRCPTARPEPSETERIRKPPAKPSDQSFGSKLAPS